MTEWVRTYENGADYIECVGGLSWNEGSPPRWWHRCRPQTRGWLRRSYVERCRCGAIRFPGFPWADRNQTRRHRARKRREALVAARLRCQR